MQTQTSLTCELSSYQQRAYRVWQKHYPTFDLTAYARWIEQHGYYHKALDPSKPDFYEYAAVYLSKCRPQPGQARNELASC